jgi:long-chain acyl-CoA synthetase
VIGDKDFKKVVLDDIDRIAKEQKLSGLEKPKDISFTADAFSVENNLLTPTFKLKRNVARDHFKPQIDEMYEVLKTKGY